MRRGSHLRLPPARAAPTLAGMVFCISADAVRRYARELLLVASLCLAPSAAAFAQAQDEEPVPEAPPGYEAQIMRLSEILGALHFLREICRGGDSLEWRVEMETLLAAEAPGPDRKTRMVARFNHGFETLNAVYRRCTPAAVALIERYLEEGRTISDDIRLRYSQ